MALLATTKSGTFSNIIYNVIDDTSASMYVVNNVMQNNIGSQQTSTDVNAKKVLWCPTGMTATTATFSIGTTNSITHMGIRVNRWLISTTVSICLLDNNNSIVNNSNFTFSTNGNYCLYPVDTYNSSTPTNLFSNSYSWQTFKFTSPLFLSPTSSYAIQFNKSNNNDLAYIHTSATISATTSTIPQASQLFNIQKFFITSATQTAGSTDSIFLQGEFISGTSFNPCNIIMDGTSSTNSYNGIELSYGSSMIFKTASNTNYYLKLNGDLVINTGASFNIGNNSYNLPSTSTATIEFNSKTASAAGLIVRGYGKMETYGATMVTKSYLNVNASTSSIVTNSITNWKSNDVLILSPTDYTPTEIDSITISTISGNQIISTSNLSFTHSGTNPYIGEIGNITRNIKIIGNPTYSTYIDLHGGDCNFQYTEFSYIGSNLDSNGIQSGVGTSSVGNYRCGYGVNFGTDLASHKGFTTVIPDGTYSVGYSGFLYTKNRIFQGCSFRKLQNFFNNAIFWCWFNGTTNNARVTNGLAGCSQLSDILIDNNIIYDITYTKNNSVGIGGSFYMLMSSFNNNAPFVYYPKSYTTNSGTVSNNLFIGMINYIDSNSTNYSEANCFFMNDFAFINNIITGSRNPLGGTSYWAHTTSDYYNYGDIYGNIFHSNGGTFSDDYSITRHGCTFKIKNFNKTVNNCIWWKNNIGLNLSNSMDSTFINCNLYSNRYASVILNNGHNNIKLISCTISGTGLSNSIGFNINPNYLYSSAYNSIIIDNCIIASHSTDININPYYLNVPSSIIINNSTLTAPISISGSNNLSLEGSVRFNNINSGTYSTNYKFGSVSKDTTIFYNNSNSTKIIPNILNNIMWTNIKFQFGKKTIPTVAGKRCIISVYLRKSGSGIEPIYNGNQISMYITQNSGNGINQDTLITTSSTASDNGKWERIIGYTPTALDNSIFDVYLTCDGNVGFINIDKWELDYLF